ncbi:hypothetical protein [Poritiphilus flavus]|uniref:Uncharacterized protein n=1 Tax=Poritiphilus flavus TaxID=2697053 RepID=A0A6L9EG46_9FLAO|nr:hypothetical protein [Poritiphilus flavus]NAS13750.1 hypothetical protein [Poritiphilus flavus]
MKTLKIRFPLFVLFILTLSASCESTEACEEDNIGTIALENKRTEGNLHLYINPVRIGSNTPGDISVPPGEKASIDIPAGSPNIVVRLIVTSCSGERCMVRSTQLDEKSLDVSSCEVVNLAY